MTGATYVRDVVIPAALRLLPSKMDTPAARALLHAIAMQESRCIYRRQMANGPARGLWEFELGGGVVGVLTHAASRAHLYNALLTLSYPPAATALYAALEHNDILAAVCARLLLWTDAKGLPGPTEAEVAWAYYLRTWNPGRPHRDTWDAFYETAWQAVGVEAA